MKETDHILSLLETEQLCQMYLDCRLSVLEEQELKYVLSRIEYTSSLIDEVRGVMGIEEKIVEKKMPSAKLKRTHSIYNYKLFLGIAASFALLIVIAISLFRNSSVHYPDDSYYIAYADGQRLSEEEAKRQIFTEIQAADEFVREMDEMEHQERTIIDNLTSINTFRE